MWTIYDDWEAIMRQMLITSLLAGALVFVGGVIFGWEYAMLLAIAVMFGISLVELLRRKL